MRRRIFSILLCSLVTFFVSSIVSSNADDGIYRIAESGIVSII